MRQALVAAHVATFPIVAESVGFLDTRWALLCRGREQPSAELTCNWLSRLRRVSHRSAEKSCLNILSKFRLFAVALPISHRGRGQAQFHAVSVRALRNAVRTSFVDSPRAGSFQLLVFFYCRLGENFVPKSHFIRFGTLIFICVLTAFTFFPPHQQCPPFRVPVRSVQRDVWQERDSGQPTPLPSSVKCIWIRHSAMKNAYNYFAVIRIRVGSEISHTNSGSFYF